MVKVRLRVGAAVLSVMLLAGRRGADLEGVLPRRRSRLAPQAGTEPGSMAAGDIGEELAVLPLRLARRAGEPAEDAGGGHADEGAPIPGRIACQQGGIEDVIVRQSGQGGGVCVVHEWHAYLIPLLQSAADQAAVSTSAARSHCALGPLFIDGALQ